MLISCGIIVIFLRGITKTLSYLSNKFIIPLIIVSQSLSIVLHRPTQIISKLLKQNLKFSSTNFIAYESFYGNLFFPFQESDQTSFPSSGEKWIVGSSIKIFTTNSKTHTLYQVNTQTEILKNWKIGKLISHTAPKHVSRSGWSD